MKLQIVKPQAACAALAFVLALAFVGSSVRAQLSPEEAMKRLHEKQAARAAERDKMVSIKQGDLDDLKSEISKLKAQVESLQKQLAAAGSAKPAVAARPATPGKAPADGFVPTALAPGLTIDAVRRFLDAHQDTCEIAEETPTLIKVTVKGHVNLADKTSPVRPLSTMLIAIANGKVTAVGSQPIH